MDNNEVGQIGRKLRDARVAKGLTLDDLQQTTKIQKRFLIAIEDENFDELPGDFYVRAFIKQYAETVGLDGEALLQEFNEQLPDVHSVEYEEKITENEPATRSSKTKTSSGLDNLRQYIPTVIVVVIVIAILGAIWLTAIHSRSNNKSTNADSSSVSVSSSSTKKTSSSSKRASSSSKSESKKDSSSSALKVTAASRTSSAATFNVTGKVSSDYTLGLSATESSWLQVTSGGSTLYSGTLESGGSKSVKVDSSATSITLSVGNGAGTKVKLNGKTLDITDSGTYPNVRTVTIQLNGTSSSSSN